MVCYFSVNIRKKKTAQLLRINERHIGQFFYPVLLAMLKTNHDNCNLLIVSEALDSSKIQTTFLCAWDNSRKQIQRPAG